MGRASPVFSYSVGGIFLGPLFNVSYGSRYGLGCEILNGYS